MNPVALLGDLIRIPSVNPDGNPGTDQTGEAGMAAFLAGLLGEWGGEVRLDEVEPGRPNVLARFPASTPGRPKLLLAPHMDTVSVEGMRINPFSGEVREGKVWGRGATDTKGPMAAMLCALESNRHLLGDLAYEVWFAGLMGEEAGLQGSRALAGKERFDFVIAAEPTGLRTVTSHKGAARIIASTRGKSAHSSTPEAGINAIELMLDALGGFRERFASIDASDEVLGRPTMNIGTIQGGTKSNIVPDLCTTHIDLRAVPQMDVPALIDKWKADFPFLQVETLISPPLNTDRSHPLVGLLDELGAPPDSAPWFCDAASFAEVGTPAVALGPGGIARAHTVDEWISVDDLLEGTALFDRFIKSLRH